MTISRSESKSFLNSLIFEFQKFLDRMPVVNYICKSLSGIIPSGTKIGVYEEINVVE